MNDDFSRDDQLRYDADTYDTNAYETDAYDAPAHDDAFPWPPVGDESVASAFGRTWTGAALHARRFFRAMPAEGAIGAALLYYIPLGIAVSGAGLFWTMVRGTATVERDEVLGRVDLMGEFSPVLEFLLSPLLLLLSLFLSAGVVHLLLKAFGGANRDFGFTTRVFAFSYSPQILGVLPVAGNAIGFAWMVVVAIIGLREGHRTTLSRVLPAVLIPVGIGLFFVAVAAFIAATGAGVLTR